MPQKFNVDKARALGYSDQEIQSFMAENNLVPKMSMGGFLKNVGKSALSLGKDIVTSPIALYKLKTAAEKGQLDLKQIAKNFIQTYKDKYGGIDNLQRTLYQDPVGVAGDIATVLSGAGAGVKAAGISDDLARGLSIAGRTLDPISAVGRVGGAAVRPIARQVKNLGKGMEEFGQYLPARGMGRPAQLKSAMGKSPIGVGELWNKYNIAERSPEEFSQAANLAGQNYDKLLKASTGAVETRKIANGIIEQIEKLKPLAEMGSQDAISSIRELSDRLSALTIKKGASGMYSPLETTVEDILQSKKAAYKDMPKNAFAQAMAQPGKAEGIQRYYRNLISSLEDVAPGSKQLGREQSALLEFAKLAEGEQGRNVAKMALSPIRLGTYGVTSAVQGVPGTVALMAAETALNNPKVLSKAGGAFERIGKGIQSAKLPSIPPVASRASSAAYQTARGLRMASPSLTALIPTQPAPKQQTTTNSSGYRKQPQPSQKAQQSGYAYKPNYTTPVQIGTNISSPFSKTKKVKRGSFY